jgi:hypothetical protein
MAINDGGAAFPEAGLSGLPNGEFIQGRAGMSLRDYFAAKALQSIIQIEGINQHAGSDEIDAKIAYRYADAMLAVRAKDAAQ